MKIKIFGIIFMSIILGMLVSGIGSAFSESLKMHAAQSIFYQVTGSNEIGKNSLEDIQRILSSKYKEKYKEVSKNVNSKYYWFFIMGFVVQVILVIGIAIIASLLTINAVKRCVRL